MSDTRQSRSEVIGEKTEEFNKFNSVNICFLGLSISPTDLLIYLLIQSSILFCFFLFIRPPIHSLSTHSLTLTLSLTHLLTPVSDRREG